MIIFRKILFYLLLALYLVLCPVIILYALGYIFTPKLEEGLTKTGLIHIETLPSNALISIGSRHYAERTPATVRNLLPGDYDLKISLRGYRPWLQRVKVDPGKAVSLEKILLVPQKVKARSLSAGPFEEIWPILGTRYLLLKGGRHAGDLKVFDWRSEVLRPVFSEKASFVDAKLAEVFTVRESSFVVLKIEVSGNTRFLGCQLDKEIPVLKDLTSLFPRGETQEILWEGDHPDYLFMLQGRDLSRLDLERMTVLPGLLSDIRGVGLFRNRIYALRGDSVIRLGCGARKGEETLVEKGIFLENLFGTTEKYKFDFVSSNTICFYGERGELFSNALPYHFVNEGVRGYQAGTAGRKIVLWQARRVGVLDFEKPERKKEFFERGPEIEWIVEGGQDIRQAYFVNDATYVLYCDRNKVFLSRGGEYRTSPEEVVTVRDRSGIAYVEKTGKLYYLEPSRGELMAAEILPEGLSLSGVINEFEKETQGAMR